MADAKDNIYAIVLFLPRKSCDNMVDLVPSSWITKTRSGAVECQYPDEKDYRQLPNWIAQLKEADEEWEYFPVEIIAYARK